VPKTKYLRIRGTYLNGVKIQGYSPLIIHYYQRVALASGRVVLAEWWWWTGSTD